MKLRRRLLIGVAACALALGSLSFGLTGFADKGVNACGDKTQSAAFCGKCGDGQCVKQCGETPTSCPRDCGGSPFDTETSVALSQTH